MWDNLYSWLRHDSGIYWVSGKAGSGKSTVMKYLYEHEEIKRLLGLWAEGSPLTIVNFFFYALGSYEQNSQEGLEKALLYQILKAVPSLVPTLLPNMWQQALLAEDAKLSLPSHGEFKTAIETIGNGLNSPLKFCFFIDGLDEYSSNCWEGISTIKALTRNPTVKIVVLSRPIPGCVQSLSGFPKLQLQDLIRQDISNYIEDILGSYQYVKRLDILQPGFFVRMCHELTSKASGVFLWIVLACRSLISKFAAHDNHSELLERIDELSKELEDLFQLMLKIEPRYRTPAAKALLVCHRNQLHNSRDIPSICLSVLEEAGFHPSTVSQPLQLSQQMKLAKCEALEGRLRSRCCGLLEISKRIGDDHCFCKGYGKHDTLIDSVVVFMHRTVSDFLSQPGIWELNCLQSHDPTFEPFTLLSCTQLIRFSIRKIYKLPYPKNLHLSNMLNNAVKGDSLIEKSITKAMLSLEIILQSVFKRDRRSLPVSSSRLSHCAHLLRWNGKLPYALFFAVEIGMVNSMEGLLAHYRGHSRFPQGIPNILFLHVIWRPLTHCLDIAPRRPLEMAGYLFSLGADPNADPSRDFGMITSAKMTL